METTTYRNSFSLTVYQDCDPDPALNTGKWFGYASRDGHVRFQVGGCDTAQEASAKLGALVGNE